MRKELEKIGAILYSMRPGETKDLGLIEAQMGVGKSLTLVLKPDVNERTVYGLICTADEEKTS